jgi:hypothetical protein
MIHSDGAVHVSADWITTLDAERGDERAAATSAWKWQGSRGESNAESPQIKTTSENSQRR